MDEASKKELQNLCAKCKKEQAINFKEPICGTCHARSLVRNEYVLEVVQTRAGSIKRKYVLTRREAIERATEDEVNKIIKILKGLRDKSIDVNLLIDENKLKEIL